MSSSERPPNPFREGDITQLNKEDIIWWMNEIGTQRQDDMMKQQLLHEQLKHEQQLEIENRRDEREQEISERQERRDRIQIAATIAIALATIAYAVGFYLENFSGW